MASLNAEDVSATPVEERSEYTFSPSDDNRRRELWANRPHSFQFSQNDQRLVSGVFRSRSFTSSAQRMTSFANCMKTLSHCNLFQRVSSKLNCKSPSTKRAPSGSKQNKLKRGLNALFSPKLRRVWSWQKKNSRKVESPRLIRTLSDTAMTRRTRVQMVDIALPSPGKQRTWSVIQVSFEVSLR